MTSPSLADVLSVHLHHLYGPADAATALSGLLALAERTDLPPRPAALTEDDVWLIAYADHVSDGDLAPLQVMDRVLRTELAGLVNGVHLLPFYPWTSDDGFAVTDHRTIDAALGTWADITALAASHRVMVDAVVNHVSAAHDWVAAWLEGRGRARILEPDSDFDTSAVSRPRTSPLLTPFTDTGGNTRRAWTTFGPDQVDLDYHNPEVLVTMTETLLYYATQGASVIRLDAIGYLWKQSGTSCLHLPQTHEVVRLWRTMLDHCAPGTLVITETNVPHAQNVTYFGTGDDEAHLVYQFSLAPLVLSAFVEGTATDLRRWAASLPFPAVGTAFFNFLGCHDGIGLRPVEGLLTTDQIAELCALAEAAGGGVSFQSGRDGSRRPYELNTTYLDALDAVAGDGAGGARAVAAHAILLSLQGVPGLWFGAVVGLRNDHELVRRTGRLRSINRSRLGLAELRAHLENREARAGWPLAALQTLVGLRRENPAFGPDSPQRVLPGPAWMFAVERGRHPHRATVVVNVTRRQQRLPPAVLDGGALDSGARWRDRLAVAVPDADGGLTMPPHGVAWLEEISAPSRSSSGDVR